jgi:hypothetical protein
MEPVADEIEVELLEGPSLSRRLARETALFLVMLALAMASTRPLYKTISEAIPQGTQPAATVPLFNLWTVWWNADRLTHGLAHYWEGPIFHPTAGTFAFSEPQPTLGLVAPLYYATGSLALAYNVYLLINLALNGWVMSLLMRRMGQGFLIAALGGAMCVLLPYVHWQLGVLQLVPLWGILWMCLALENMAAAPTLARGAVLGVAFGMTYWLCNYYGLFLSVLMAICGLIPLAGCKLLRWRTWAAIAVSLVVAGVMCGPIVWAQVHYILGLQFVRDIEYFKMLSTTIEEYLRPEGINWLGTNDWLPRFNVERSMSSGHLKTLLALVGLIYGLCRSDYRRRTIFWGTMLAAAIALASASHIRAGDWSLHQSLAKYWPGFAQIRTLLRFAVFAQLASIVLAGYGLLALRQWLSGRGHHAAATVLVLIVGGLAVFEVCPPITRIYILPRPVGTTHWTDWVREQTPTDSVVAGIPCAIGESEEAYEQTTLWMLWQSRFERRIVNGYSGFFPQTYQHLKPALNDFPTAEGLHQLESAGVDYCIVDTRKLSGEQLARLTQWPERLEEVYAKDWQGFMVYRIVSIPSVTPAAAP